MRTPLPGPLSLLGALALTGIVLAGSALAATRPVRARAEASPITALAVAGGAVVYAVADNAAKTDCAHVYLWRPSGRASRRWRLGTPTDEPCREGLSTGSGVLAVSTSARRALWIQYAGGNLRDYELFTATTSRTQPRRLAFVERDVDAPAAMVVGKGTPASVPYAVDDRVTLLGDDGAAVFKWTAPSPVRLITSGTGPAGAAVAVVLASGEADLLSRAGAVVSSYDYLPGEVTALSLAAAGLVVQEAGSVEIRTGAQQVTVGLPGGAKMLDFNQGRIFYALRGSVHALEVAPRVDSLLVRAASGRSVLASDSAAGGLAWAIGNRIDWACAGCVDYGP